MSKVKVKIPAKASEQLDAIRDSAEVNMMDYHGVKSIAVREDLTELFAWMVSNKGEYLAGIHSGFEEGETE